MKRKRLSSRLVAEKIITVVLFTAVLGLCIKTDRGLLIIALPIMAVIDYAVFYLPQRIEFDDDTVFITNGKETIAVSFRQITMLKITWISLGSKTVWKLKYIAAGRERSARFYPRNYADTLAPFIQLLKAKNPNAKFVSWSFK
jgi:hypothetical protein